MKLRGILVGSLFLIAIILGSIVIRDLYIKTELSKLDSQYDTRLSRYTSVLDEAKNIPYLLTIVDNKSYQTAKSLVKMTTALYNQWFSEEEYSGVVRITDIPRFSIKESGYIIDNTSSTIKVYLLLDIIYKDTKDKGIYVFAEYTERGELMNFGRQ